MVRECEAKGAVAEAVAVDVTDTDALKAAVLRADEAKALDLVLANAGVAHTTLGNRRLGEVFGPMMEVNVRSQVETVMAALPLMRARKKGQLAVTASVQAFLPEPRNVAYCASKVKKMKRQIRAQVLGFRV